MSTDKIERVITLANRLIGALEGDIVALENGTPQAMKTIDPEIQKLAALYAREAAGLTAPVAKAAPEALRSTLAATTERFRETLKKQSRLLTRMRNASEGMVQAIAEEVEKRRQIVRPYGPSAPARPAGAMIFNATA
jgi:hypothetical protein